MVEEAISAVEKRDELVKRASALPNPLGDGKAGERIAVVKNEIDYANVIQKLQHYKEEIQKKRGYIRQILQTRTWDKSVEKMKAVITSLL